MHRFGEPAFCRATQKVTCSGSTSRSVSGGESIRPRLEAILAGNGPRAIILTMPDTACVVAILASQPLLASGLPVLAIDSAVACRLRVKPRWHVSGASAWPVTQDAPVDQ